MSKKILTFALAAVLGVAFAAPATAAVQSVRVGGDVVVRGIYRDNLDFDGTASGQQSDAWYMTTTRLWVGAELTDNVSALVRLLNEREWGIEGWRGETDITLDLSYIKVGDMFVPGLALTLGRQEILLGRGFLVGHRNPSGFWPGGEARPDRTRSLRGAVDLTARKSFDAIRFDYEAGVVPMDVTFFGAKIQEDVYDPSGYIGRGYGEELFVNNDTDLWALNVAYDTGNAIVEGYLLNLKNRAIVDNDVWTVGGRLNHEVFSVPGLAWDAELAYQFGKALANVDQRAWGGALDVNYTFANPYMPVLGAGMTWYSGDDGTDSTKNKNFNPMFPDDLAGRFGSLWQAVAVFNGMPATNLQAYKLYGSMSPADGHEVSLAVFPAHRLDKAPAGDGKNMGWGLDLGYSYKYTEDLTLGLLGSYIRAHDDLIDFVNIPAAQADKSSYQLIGTVALSF